MKLVLAGVLVVVAVLAVGNAAHLRVLPPTGAAGVGRAEVAWVRGGRDVPATVWYPAVRGTGHRLPYVSNLSRIEDGLVASGEVNRVEAAALRFVRDGARGGATVSGRRLPLLVLSPGNLTNVAFYASLAEELASHGYVVVGIDHPYSVAAVPLHDGSVAVGRGPVPESRMAEEMRERVGNIRFVLDRVAAGDPRVGFLRGRVDPARVGVLGHSLGGIAAAEACRADARLRACLNIDGQAAGGPFSAGRDGQAPKQPFMFLTKERAIHPVLLRRFERAGTGAYRVVLPAASHASFADSARFAPSLLPWFRTSDKVLATSRSLALAFFDHELRGTPSGSLRMVDATTDVFVSAFPLRGRPPLPAQ